MYREEFNANLPSAPGLVDSPRAAPAHLKDLYRCTASQTKCVADGREGNEAKILSIGTSQYLPSNRDASESAGKENRCVSPR